MSYEIFERSCHEWIGKFGLTDWMIEINRMKLPAVDAQVMARCSLNLVQRSARILWNDAFIEDDSSRVAAHDPKGAALHEVLHIVMATYGEVCAKLGSADGDIAQAEEHGTMRRIMRALGN